MSDLQALGVIPANHDAKRDTFQSIIHVIWKGIESKALDGPSASLQNSSQMTSSAEFHEKSRSYQDTLASSMLATISDASAGKVVIATINGERITGKVCFVFDIMNQCLVQQSISSDSKGWQENNSEVSPSMHIHKCFELCPSMSQ